MTRKEFLNATVALAASAVPVAFVSMCAFAAALPEAEGDFTWGGRQGRGQASSPSGENKSQMCLKLMRATGKDY